MGWPLIRSSLSRNGPDYSPTSSLPTAPEQKLPSEGKRCGKKPRRRERKDACAQEFSRSPETFLSAITIKLNDGGLLPGWFLWLPDFEMSAHATSPPKISHSLTHIYKYT